MHTPDLSTNELSRRGLMLILSSPSGAGKTTLTRMLLQDRALDLTLSVSVTTRARRSSEVDGIHYRFIQRPDFDALRDRGELLEWAEVHGNCYGTPKRPVDEILAQGRDVLFDIDYQGAAQVRQRAAADVVSIFILPPSMSELRARLERRNEDAKAVIDKRLDNAREEIRRWEAYDYVIVNDDLEKSYRQVTAIIAAERLRRERTKVGVAKFVENLLR